MSGGPSVTLPTWLSKAQDAFEAIAALGKGASKYRVANAQHKFKRFHDKALEDWRDYNRIKSSLVSLVMKNRDIAAEVHRLYEQELELEALKRGGK